MSEYFRRKTREYETLLARDLDAAEAVDADGDTCLEMAAAYLEDGRHFLAENDLPNALAAFAYGHGWLDAGERTGVVIVDTPDDTN